MCEEACPTLAIQLTPNFEFCQYDVLTLVAEKEDLLVDHGGKNQEYNFYRHAGITISGGKGEHINEESPVDLRSNLP
jgi:NADH-quinone oxidoreductase subunit I